MKLILNTNLDFNQIKSFLSNYDNLKTIEKQFEDCINIYDNMSNYNKSYNIMIVGLGQIGFRHFTSNFRN